jgi:hypothetical protein
MQSLKTDIASGVAISAVALTIALAWGRPFVIPHAALAAGAQTQVERQQQQSQPAPIQTPKAKPHPGMPQAEQGQ